MFSVLILDKETKEDFNLYRPLFTEAIKRGEIGICDWYKDVSGGNVANVLPKLYEMVGDKKEWRAIIVQSRVGHIDKNDVPLEERPETDLLAVNPRNPFDYDHYSRIYKKEIDRVKKDKETAKEIEKKKARAKARRELIEKELEASKDSFLVTPGAMPGVGITETLTEAEKGGFHSAYDQVLDENVNMHKECEIPLIKLTQMLGGIPAPDVIVAPFRYDINTKLSDLDIDNNVETPEEEEAILEVAPESIENESEIITSEISEGNEETEESAEVQPSEEPQAKEENEIVEEIPQEESVEEVKTTEPTNVIEDEFLIPVEYSEEPVSDDERRRLEKQKWSTKVIHDETAEKLYDRLKQEYRFRANPPKQILLIGVRPQSEDSTKMMKDSWANYDELQSSEFWHYNHYPQICRFLTYEVEQRGLIQEQGDLFRLWLMVSILASNNLDPSTVQAHRLYKIGIELDRELLADTFEQTAVRLVTASVFLNRSIDQDKQWKMNKRIDPPEISVEVAVDADDSRIGQISMDHDCYGYVARDDFEDTFIWNTQRAEADDNLRLLRRLTNRAVENSAERMRKNCEYETEQVEALSDFQAQELDDQLRDEYQKVLDTQSELPFGKLGELNKQKEDRHNRVIGAMKSRMTASKVIIGYVVTELLMLFAILPSLINAYKTNTSVKVPLFASLLVGAVVYFIVVFATVYFQYKDLKERISRFNISLSALKQMINNNAYAYSMFLGSVGSHMKGSSYVNILREQNFKREDMTIKKRKHLRDINAFKEHLQEWARAVYINCNFDAIEAEEIEFDASNIPNFDSLYTLATNKNHKIPMNETGIFLETDFGFIESLQVVREELYDERINSI